MDHPGPENIVHWELLGKNFFFERGLADWKLYYKVRNMVWLKRAAGGRLRAIAMALTYALGRGVDRWHPRACPWSGRPPATAGGAAWGNGRDSERPKLKRLKV